MNYFNIAMDLIAASTGLFGITTIVSAIENFKRKEYKTSIALIGVSLTIFSVMFSFLEMAKL